MSTFGLAELVRCRHRYLETRIASLGVDPRARRARVVQLAEELVAHATVEQMVLYPYAEKLLGLRHLSLEIERALDALLGVVSGIDDDSKFGVGLARLSAAFDHHVHGDEHSLLPMVEELGRPEDIARIGRRLDEFERALTTGRAPGAAQWAEPVSGAVVRGWRN